MSRMRVVWLGVGLVSGSSDGPEAIAAARTPHPAGTASGSGLEGDDPVVEGPPGAS